MGRVGLCIASSLAALALGAADPKEAARNQGGNTNQNVATALENVAAALKEKPVQPLAHDKPCSKSPDDRSSDLCAQWTAVDAAQSSSDAAWWIGGVGVLIALLTLYVAVRAALYARDAATHTEAGAKIAKDALEHQREMASHSHRAYLDADDARFTRWSEGDDDDLGLCYKASLKLRNFGETPALTVLYRHALFESESEPDFRRVKSTTLQRTGRVSPTDSLEISEIINISRRTYQAIKGGEPSVWMIVECFYSDIFKKRYEQAVIFGLDTDLEWYLHKERSERPVKT